MFTFIAPNDHRGSSAGKAHQQLLVNSRISFPPGNCSQKDRNNKKNVTMKENRFVKKRSCTISGNEIELAKLDPIFFLVHYLANISNRYSQCIFQIFQIQKLWIGEK